MYKQQDMIALVGKNDQNDGGKVGHFRDEELLYGSLVMDAVIITIAVYFIFIKSCKRFEWTILLCMFVKFSLQAFYATDAYL